MTDITDNLDPVDPYADIRDYGSYIEIDDPNVTELDYTPKNRLEEEVWKRYDNYIEEPYCSKQINQQLKRIRAFEAVNDIEYRDTGSEIQSPSETIRKGYGDDEDQTVLLANFCEAFGVEGRFVVLESWLSFEVELRIGREDIVEEVLSDFSSLYAERTDTETGKLSYERFLPYSFIDESSNSGYHLFVADPVHSDYVGDLSGLQNSGLVTESNQNWEWVNFIQYQNAGLGHWG